MAPVAAAQSPTAPSSPAAAAGTPVLGVSAMTADQLSAWYAASGVTSTSPVAVADLARLFIDEGAAQGVRGDIAFAQSMLETGYLRYGGIVKPGDLNFSGLGACDNCPRGLAFPSATLGVRAQIQHLYAYAAPGATPAALARPLADARFARVQPAGRAALWESMGNGNWATGPDYARKVLTLWRGMLRSAGVPEPAPRTAGVAPVQSLLVAPDGAARLAGWRTRKEPLADGTRILGAPTSLTPGRGVCLVRWDGIGAAALVRGGARPCDATSSVRWIRLTGAGWRTTKGLAPGEPLTRLRSLYPHARRGGAFWRLVAGRDDRHRQPVTRLRAEVAPGGVVRALWVYPAPTA